MSDLETRLLLLLAVITMAAGAAIWMRHRESRGRFLRLSSPLPPGVYLFSSTQCGDCRHARDRLHSLMGDVGFTEVSWEAEPGPFTDHGVDRVPATLIVGSQREAELIFGIPPRDLPHRLSP